MNIVYLYKIILIVHKIKERQRDLINSINFVWNNTHLTKQCKVVLLLVYTIKQVTIVDVNGPGIDYRDAGIIFRV